MTNYDINLTVQSIWAITRVFFDIVIVWFLFYWIIKFVRNNARTIQIFKGILLILIVNWMAKLLGLNTVAYFSNIFINWGFLAAIIIFQPEIRGILERLGKSTAFNGISTLLANEKQALVEEIYEAVVSLSKSKVGALISIEQDQSMQDYVATGTSINAKVSKELLSSIFMTTTPLHDGAVIIQGDQIACASAYFPPTSANLSSRYGARHRAALGISEINNCLTIVVSEETSAISVAEKGKIFMVDEKQLKDYLSRVICNEEIEIRRHSQERMSLLLDEPEVVVENEEEEQQNVLSRLFKRHTRSEDTTTTSVTPISNNNQVKEIDMKVPVNNREKYYKERNRKILQDLLSEAVDIKDNTAEIGGLKDE